MTRLPGYPRCFVCGPDNPDGMSLELYKRDGLVTTSYTAEARHQGFGNVLHGGIIASLLDEVMAWTVYSEDIVAVTARMEVRYRQPVPIGSRLEASAEIVNRRGRLLEARGEIRDQEGALVAEGRASFMRVSDEMRQEVERARGESPGS